jgi:phosphopantothenoylcysteine decarboxylase/phosphopantothenate--cysteine ligase
VKTPKILVTAGPTREAIDPVRFISNHSTGKMGIEIANAFAEKNADVNLILGPTELRPHQSVKVFHVESAKEMFDVALKLYAHSDIAIFSAAVADYTPEIISKEKIKKDSDIWNLKLIKTKDIALELGKLKKTEQVNVVFALETEHEMEHALNKMQKKNADFVVLNSLRDKGAGFGYDTNKITILFQNGLSQNFELQSKQSLAKAIVNEALNCYFKKQS